MGDGKPQHKRCNFFLWQSDADAREKLTVLSNSRTEPFSANNTPTKPSVQGSGLLTPQTDTKVQDVRGMSVNRTPTPSKSGKARMMMEDTDEFSWDDSTDAEELTKLLEPPPQPDFGQEGPRKAPRTESFMSPGKRKLSDIENDGRQSTATFTPTSIFSSRTQTRLPPASAEVSMTPTPGRYRNVLSTDARDDFSELGLQALKILESHKVVVPKQAQDELLALLNKHDLKMKGIMRGRDISRIALKKHEETIMKLNERITSLESQREMDRAIIDGLRGREIAFMIPWPTMRSNSML
ncbi:PX domain-containing protein [Aspergillus fumigatus Z5]|nr:PX domain-containing protein [Aspergillus fumigatus Z5]